MRVDEIATTETVLKGADYIVVDSEADGTRKLAMQAIIDAGAAATIIWRWNEIDATQFRVALDEVGGGGVVLSKVAGADGPRLRVAFPTKVDGLKLTVLTLADLVLPLVQTDVRRYVFRFRVVGCNAAKTQSEWYSVGLALCCNDGVTAAFYGQVTTARWSAASRTAQVSAGVASFAGSTPAWGGDISALIDTDDSALCVPFAADVTQRHVGANPPDWRGALSVGVPVAGAEALYKHCSRRQVTEETVAVGGAWNTEVFDTVGLAFLGTTGTQADHYFEIDQIRVETHPMDL